MARRGFSRTRFVRPAARTKVWIGANVGSTTLVASSDQLISSFNASALLLRPFTILRSHVVCLYSSDQQTVTESPFGSMGMIIVKDTAISVGITAIPAPGSEVDDNFFIYQPMNDRFVFVTGVGIGTHDGREYVIDSKAMRKVGTNDDVAVTTSQVAGVGAKLVVQGRFLVQLH